MNSIVKLNTHYNVLKKLATFNSPSEAVCKTIYKVLEKINLKTIRVLHNTKRVSKSGFLCFTHLKIFNISTFQLFI